jgi:predicted  nucleic acid-binding Zn-ribbon protein
MQLGTSFARQARRLRRSRDIWRTRAADQQKEIRSLRVKIRDLTKSRDRWKDDAQQRQAKIVQLQDQLDLRPAESCLGGV